MIRADPADILAPPSRAGRKLRWQVTFRRWEQVAHAPLEGAEVPRKIRQDWLSARAKRRAAC